MITNIILISLLVLVNIILPIWLIYKASKFRRTNGKAYQEKYGKL